MIDIHNHLLFGIDDGIRTYEDTLEILRVAQSIGINSLIFTPHYSAHRMYLKCSDEVEMNFRFIKNEVLKKEIDIKLFLGYELDQNLDILNIIDAGYTVNNSRYILVDFCFDHFDISESVYEIMRLGYVIIIAHAERISYADINFFRQLKSEGALIQINAKNIFKGFFNQNRRMARHLLKHNLVDFVASDAHELSDLVYMSKAFNYVNKKYGQKRSQELFYENAQKIINYKTEDFYG